MNIYGKKIVEEYLNKNKKINKAFVYEGFTDKNLIFALQKKNIEIKWLSKMEIEKMEKGNHQGIIISVPEYRFYSAEDLYQDKVDEPFYLILDHLEDPHNLGAIIRTAVAAGIDGIILPRDRSVDVGPTVMKTSAGGLDQIKIYLVTNINETIKKLKEKNVWVYGTSLGKDSIDYSKMDYKGSLAIVIGNEGKGMSKLTESLCDGLIHIPIYGGIESLNASVAAGILMYKAVEQRRK